MLLQIQVYDKIPVNAVEKHSLTGQKTGTPFYWYRVPNQYSFIDWRFILHYHFKDGHYDMAFVSKC